MRPSWMAGEDQRRRDKRRVKSNKSFSTGRERGATEGKQSEKEVRGGRTAREYGVEKEKRERG